MDAKQDIEERRPAVPDGEAGPEERPDDAAKVASVTRSAAMMSACTLASRATGFVRTWAMAFALGNTVLAAGFSLANNMPNMIYELVAGGALAAAFVPIYHQQRNQISREAGTEYARNLLSIALIALGLVSILASVFAPQVMATQSIFSSASSETVGYAVWFFRFFAFQIICYGVSAIFSGLLNAEREFFWPAVSSIFMNIISIATFLSFPFVSEVDETAGLVVLAVGITLSIAVMACVQIPALARLGFRFRFRVRLRGAALGDTMRLALPAIASTAVNLVALSFMNSCALVVADNGPASISYAWMWYQFPYGVLGVALSTALFTEMSEYASKHEWEGFTRSFRFGLKSTWLLIIPMAVLVYVCASQLIGLYAAGRFTAEDIVPVADLLRAWSINLPLYAAFMYVSQAYSALKDMKTVAVVNTAMTVVQVLLYMTLTGVFFPGFSIGLVGIAVSDIIKYIVVNVILLALLRKRSDRLQLRLILVPTAKILVASLVGGVVGEVVNVFLRSFLSMDNILGAFVGLVVTGAVSLAVILVAAKLLHVEELDGAIAALRRRLGR